MREGTRTSRQPGARGLYTKLTLGFVGLLAILLAVGVESITLLSNLGGSIDVILRENYVSVIASERMKEALERMDSGALFALAGHAEQGRTLAAQNQPRFEEALRTELGNITLPGEQERAELLRQLFAAYVPSLQRILDPAVPLEERRSLYFEKLLPTFQQIKRTANEITDLNQHNMVQAKDRARGLAVDANRRMAVMLLLGTAFAGICVFFLWWSLLGPLGRLPEAAAALDRKVEPPHQERRQVLPEPTLPTELVEAAVRDVAASYQAEQVELVSDIDPDAPPVLVDRERTGLVLSSLLRNSLAHTPSGGTVTVKAEPQEGRTRFTVVDHGDGIPPGHIERIFEPFYQIPGTQNLGGVGLGLAVARDIVQAHGGEIHCESQEGRGTTFWFTLPAAAEGV